MNPVVITAEAAAARGDELAAGLAGSFTMGVGQFCTKPGVVLVPAGAGFTEALAAATTAGPATMLNDRIRSSYAEHAAELSGRPGVDVVCGGLPESTGGVGPLALRTTAAAVIADPEALLIEVFGPTTLLIEYTDENERRAVLAAVPGSLTGTLYAEPGEDVADVLATLSARVGRVLFAGWPTGVAVSWAQHHGGPYPATTSLFTSVGASAIRRFLQPLTLQSAPTELLPAALRDDNPLGIPRRVDGVLSLPSR